MTEWIEKLRQWVAESDNMVFFGGAGVSTESGIPDFRSVDGLYHQKFQYPPETILSHSFYVRHKAEFYGFYRAKMLAPWAQPNAAHRKLAQWEQEGKLKAVISSLHLTIADTGWAKAAWGKLYGQWLAGANIFVYDHEKFTPADILHKIGQYRITSLCAPPTIYRFLIREDLSKYDLSSLEYCTTAGEALNGAVYADAPCWLCD